MADDQDKKTVSQTLFERLLDRFDTRAFIAIELSTSMVILTFVLAVSKPETDAFKVLLGAMLTVGFASAIGWYFQSSAGSEKKDTTQAKVAEELAKKVNGTGTGDMQTAVAAAALAAPAAAAIAAPAAAAIAAPPAAAIAAPPVVAEVVPPAVEKAVADALAAHDEVEKQKPST